MLHHPQPGCGGQSGSAGRDGSGPGGGRPAGRVIIRSHGESRKTYRRLEERGRRSWTPPAPNVKRIHHIVARAEEQGRQPVIIGAPDHPEVAAIAGWCSRPVVLSGVEDLEKWLEEQPERRDLPLTFVSQTTSTQKSGMTA